MARPDYDDAIAGGSDEHAGCVLYEECEYHRQERTNPTNRSETNG